MLDAPASHPFGVEESLHCVHLDHRVADRRAGGERHAVAGVLLVQVSGLHVQVEGPLAAAGLDAGDTLHLGRRLQVLEVMGLVDEDVIDSKFVKDQPIVLLVLGQQVFQPVPRAAAFCFSMVLMMLRLARCAPSLALSQKQLVVFRDLLAQELSPGTPATCRCARSCEWVTMMPSHSPLAILAVRMLAAFLGEVFLGGDQQLGVGVELHELAGELLQHVVRDDVHRLFDEPGLLHLHAGGGHREGLPRSDSMGQQRVARTHAAPDRVLLMLAEAERLAHAGKIEMRAVEQPGPQVVVSVVVEPHQRSVRSGSVNTQDWNLSLISFCFSLAARVASWLTTRLSGSSGSRS